jgi:hypothetical protein
MARLQSATRDDEDGMQTGRSPERRPPPGSRRAVVVTNVEIGGNHGASSAVAESVLNPARYRVHNAAAVHY